MSSIFFLMQTTTSIASVSLSGGQGKTTLVYFLAKRLANLGYRTLVIDLDPQHNISTFLRVAVQPNQASVLEFLKGETSTNSLYPVANFSHLFVIPADDGLEIANDFLAASGFGIIQLKNRLQQLTRQLHFDFCLIDTPPQKSQLCKTGIGASDYHLIPAEPEVKGVLSLVRTQDAIASINDTGIINTQLLGVLPFRDKWYGLNRSKESRSAIEQMSHLIPDYLLLPPFRDSTLAKRAISTNQTLEDLNQDELAYPFEKLINHLQQIHERPLSTTQR